ncbi:hypothetical protein GA0111570_102179 [Raineyella antarctica]|uniref:Uncharacterized protein n=2 Tax=Raineyella antarctica TaxID=1577474 RepID=A0A1G6GEQ7_9ACTN|nr:hypothetical protein GA0111570_102179 [Raineyella antarctica]
MWVQTGAYLDMTRVLVITNNSWNDSNSTGLTTTNFFGGWDRNSIANLYCRSEAPNNDVCDQYFRITEADLVQSIFQGGPIGTRSDYVGLTKSQQATDREAADNERRLYRFFRSRRFHALLWARELLWCAGKWKNANLRDFLTEFNPEVIYMPIHGCFYMHDVLHYVKACTGAKVVLFTGDDMYSLRQVSLSPLYWINRVVLRSKVRRSLVHADLCYCMSDTQKDELSREFGDKFRIMRRGMVIGDGKPSHTTLGPIVDFVYAGNLLGGKRWKTLSMLAREIHRQNAGSLKMRLHIYSADALTQRMVESFDFPGEVFLMGEVPASAIPGILGGGDIVVHVESFELKYKMQTRLSFSTKLVDYFRSGKCIFAAGWAGANSISYLIENDAAIVASDEDAIGPQLRRILHNPEIIAEYGDKAWACGVRNHELSRIRDDFTSAIGSLVSAGQSVGRIA